MKFGPPGGPLTMSISIRKFFLFPDLGHLNLVFRGCYMRRLSWGWGGLWVDKGRREGRGWAGIEGGRLMVRGGLWVAHHVSTFLRHFLAIAFFSASS